MNLIKLRVLGFLFCFCFGTFYGTNNLYIRNNTPFVIEDAYVLLNKQDINLSNITELTLEYFKKEFENGSLTAQQWQNLFNQCSNVKKLSLVNCEPPFDGLNLQGLANVTELFLKDSSISVSGLGKILNTCTKLERLKLYNCDEIDQAMQKEYSSKQEIVELRQKLEYSNTTELDLSGKDITAAELQDILKMCTKLEKLNTYRCKYLDVTMQKEYKTKEAIVQLRKNLMYQNAKVLNFTKSYYSKEITFVALQEILSKCKNLEELYLNEQSKITSQDFEMFKWPKTLKRLDLSNTNITENGVRAVVAQSNLDLDMLTLKDCKNLNGKYVKIFCKKIEQSSADCETISWLKKELENDLENEIKDIENSVLNIKPSKINTFNQKVSWKWPLAIGCAALVLTIGAVLIYKKVSVLQNISNMIWRKQTPFVTRSNVLHQPSFRL